MPKGTYKHSPLSETHKKNISIGLYKALAEGKMKKLDLDLNEIKRLYIDEKRSIDKIAKIFNCSPATIIDRLEKINVKRRDTSEHLKLNLNRDEIEKMKDLYLNKKYSSIKIAKILKCSVNFIAKKLNEMGVPMRESKDYPIWNKGITKEMDKRIKGFSDRMKSNNPMHNEKSVEKMKNTQLRLYKEGKLVWNKGLTKETDERLMKNGINMSKIKKIQWKDENYASKQTKAILNGLYKRPTLFEQRISNLCFKFNLPFVYVGNGDFLINFKNPDFVNEKDKIVIEVFYSWFKIRDYGSVEKYKEFCKKRYEPNGWKMIFLDENDVFVDNWEEICLDKIKNFLEVKNE